MKANMKHVLSITSLGFAFALICLGAQNTVVTPPLVVAPAPPPNVSGPVPVAVPASYVWDGSEYVGIVGGQYYYLGPGNVWLAMRPARLHRFLAWEQNHPDWRAHAIRNIRYRNMGPPMQPQPVHWYAPGARPIQPPPTPVVNPGQYGPP